MQNKTMLQVVIENQLERLIHRRKMEVQLLQLIDQMPSGGLKDRLRSKHEAKLLECESDIMKLKKEIGS